MFGSADKFGCKALRLFCLFVVPEKMFIKYLHCIEIDKVLSLVKKNTKTK